MVLQGLQAYLTHLPISTMIAVPDKIKELLKEIATLCDIQRSCTAIDINSNVKSTDLVDVSVNILVIDQFSRTVDILKICGNKFYIYLIRKVVDIAGLILCYSTASFVVKVEKEC